jgi:RNA polymerase sigma-70 factor (ECF subfamily)
LSLNDEELVAEARGGSHAAFTMLMERHERLVYRVCFAYTHNRDDALDVTQDVFVKAFTRLDTFRGTGSFQAWLLRVAHRQSLDWRRRNQRGLIVARPAADLLPPSPPVQEARVQRGEVRALLEAALAQLNPQQRHAVSLRYFGQRRLREIAEVLECSEGNVKSLLFRSLRRLRKQLVEQGS